ncbi:MAG: hypothetical protein Q4G04_04385 [bacterium]|nr:hypothetical protein [bacterium]
MKKKNILVLVVGTFLMLPGIVKAESVSLINFGAVLQPGAIINDVTNPNNLNVIIVGMLLVIIILVGATIFSTKK